MANKKELIKLPYDHCFDPSFCYQVECRNCKKKDARFSICLECGGIEEKCNCYSCEEFKDFRMECFEDCRFCVYAKEHGASYFPKGD